MKPIIIAEIGQNHLGDIDLARKLIFLAKDNGADKCKFQLYQHKALYADRPDIPNVALSFGQATLLFDYGKQIGIEVFFSVFDRKRVNWCEKIGVKRYKIAFSQHKNYDLIKAVASTQKPVYISINIHSSILDNLLPEYTALYCKGCYPDAPTLLPYFDDIYPFFVGFSDHCIGIDYAKICLSRGAKVIEKHFALDHKTGVDAEWSMTPIELYELRRFADVVAQVL